MASKLTTGPSPERTASHWRATAHGVIGPHHQRSGKPIQDAWGVRDAKKEPVVAVVADGHGSEKYTRSDRGSRLAVEVVTEILAGAGAPGDQLFAPASAGAGVALATAIVEAWRARVAADIAADPRIEPPVDVVDYGSTVIGAVASATALVVVQLGDGGALVVYDDGAVERVFTAEEQIGTATHSLCSGNATSHLQVRVFDLQATPIRFVLLATDGFENAYVSAHAFQKVAPDILGYIVAHGWTIVETHLPQWLEKSGQFTGDDASAALLYRSSVPRPVPPVRRLRRHDHSGRLSRPADRQRR